MNPQQTEPTILQIRLNRPQSRAHRVLLPGHSVCTPWGRGIGKSFFQRLCWYENVARYDGVERIAGRRGVRIVHLMPTFKQCRDVHEAAAEDELNSEDKWKFLGAKIDHTRWRITFPGGSWIQWFGTREANSARGLRCDVVTMDEADDIEPAVASAIVKPWFSEPWSLRTLLIGGTPRRGRYGLLYQQHRLGLDAKDGRHFSFHATYRDAPETVDRDYVEQVRLEAEAQGAMPTFQREWECSFDSAEGLVYGLFDDNVHVRRPPPDVKWSEVLVGLDHGWEDPGVILKIGVLGSGRDAIVWVFGEVYERHKVESWWIGEARKVRAAHPTARWYGDPSRPDRIKAIADGAGVRFYETNNAIEDGVSAVADRLAARIDPSDPTGTKRTVRLFVDPSCVHTLAEFASYRRKRDPRNSERVLDDIEDANNHAMDALRYAIHSRFGKPPAPRGIGEASELGLM